LSHRSGSTALQPKIPKRDYDKIYAKIDTKDLLKELYECDENYIDDELYLLRNKYELKYEQKTEKEKMKIFNTKTNELLKLISTAVEKLYEERSFDLKKRDVYLSSSNNLR